MHAQLTSLQQLLLHIQGQAKQAPVLVVAIDGFAGAGKSTLASWLADQLEQAQVITLDDFFRPLSSAAMASSHGGDALQAYFDVAAFAADILLPLRQGHAVSWQPIDWLTEEPLSPKRIIPQGVVLVEGVFACHFAMETLMDVSVMVTTQPATCQRRVLARPQPATDWYAHWAATESWYHAHNDTLNKVDFVCLGEN